MPRKTVLRASTPNSNVTVAASAAALALLSSMNSGQPASAQPTVSRPAFVALGARSQHLSSPPRYELIDLGTFGGPDSVNNGGSIIINSGGTVVGGADTSEKDPYAPNCADPECYVQHAFSWSNGTLVDLGALPNGPSSYTNAVNSIGTTVGQSQNGLIDPASGIPESVSTVWENGKIIDLGTFGGAFSLAAAVNDRDVVVGTAENTIPDPFAQVFLPIGTTQYRAFLWSGSAIQDLGTLGSGNDAFALFVNPNGVVTGFSFTNTTPNPSTGIPTVDPFLWVRGKMYDLGSLGGTIGFPNYINDIGDVVGQSNLAGDQTSDPFLWQRGRLIDLGTFGGTFGSATALDDRDDVIGWAAYPGNAYIRGFLWRNGVRTDLGTVTPNPGPGNSFAFSNNSSGQIVGQSCNQGCTDSRAFLWENGGPMLDLNDLVQGGTGIKLVEAHFINDRGEIVVVGALPNGDVHSVVLLPCNADRAHDVGCQENRARPNDFRQSSPAPLTRIDNPLTLRGLSDKWHYWALARAGLPQRYDLRP